MLSGALGSLSSSGPQGKQMADALGAFVASGGKDSAALAKALATFRTLQAESGNGGGAMGSMLERMLSQLSGSGAGGELDVQGVLEQIQAGGAGNSGAGVDLGAMQQMLSGLQQQESAGKDKK